MTRPRPDTTVARAVQTVTTVNRRYRTRRCSVANWGPFLTEPTWPRAARSAARPLSGAVHRQRTLSFCLVDLDAFSTGERDVIVLPGHRGWHP